MKIKNFGYILCVGLAVCTAGLIHASKPGTRQIRVKSTKDFNRVLDSNTLVVAVFDKNDRAARKDKTLSRNIDLLESTIKRVADRRRYQDARIAFARINTVGHDAESLAEDYEVSAFPTVMIFQDGRVVHGAVKTGFMNTQELQLFIDNHVGNTINSFVQREAERNRRRSRRKRTPYVSYGVGYGYPYYGYGGGVGFGVGF